MAWDDVHKNPHTNEEYPRESAVGALQIIKHSGPVVTGKNCQKCQQRVAKVIETPVALKDNKING